MKKKLSIYSLDNRLPVAPFLYWHDAKKETPNIGTKILTCESEEGKKVLDFAYVDEDKDLCGKKKIVFLTGLWVGPQDLHSWCYIDDIPKPKDE